MGPCNATADSGFTVGDYCIVHSMFGMSAIRLPSLILEPGGGPPERSRQENRPPEGVFCLVPQVTVWPVRHSVARRQGEGFSAEPLRNEWPYGVGHGIHL